MSLACRPSLCDERVAAIVYVRGQLNNGSKGKGSQLSVEFGWHWAYKYRRIHSVGATCSMTSEDRQGVYSIL